MARKAKPQEERLADILAAASRLIRERGVDAVAIDDIVREAAIAKGTFYLYFRSKSDLLAKLANAVVERLAQSAEAAIARQIDPLEGFVAAIAALKMVDRDERHLADALNHPSNLELHERTNVALVKVLSPILARVVDAGRKAGAFDVADPLATIEFILAGQAFLLGDGRFDGSESEYRARLAATLVLVERALGAPRDTLAPRLAEALAGGPKGTEHGQ